MQFSQGSLSQVVVVKVKSTKLERVDLCQGVDEEGYVIDIVSSQAKLGQRRQPTLKKHTRQRVDALVADKDLGEVPGEKRVDDRVGEDEEEGRRPSRAE